MSFTYGFYNSLNGDRRYNAYQMSMLFDGLITDGVYASIGSAFVVKVGTEAGTVIVQPGRAWFNHTWSYNDADLPIDLEQSELILARIDALVIDINASDESRTNSIQWVKGTPASSPQPPTLLDEELHHQHPLCYVYRKANTETITQSDITNCVGTDDCPFVTGIVQSLSIEELIRQWRDQWAQFMAEYEESATEWNEEQQASLLAFYDEFKSEMNAFQTASNQEFDDWFSNLKVILADDVATNLQKEIEEISQTEFDHFYGLYASNISINNQTDTVTSTTDAAVVTTTFETTDTQDVITTTIVPTSGNFDYIRTTTISSENDIDTIATTYVRKAK